jgi:tRNA threonylcarbamoyladenosine biosynthesis protein TsaB
VLILSLDTTTRAGSAAVLHDDTVLAIAEGDGARTHGERLPGELAAVLHLAGVSLREIDLLTVARGPGAFTGLRIGLAAMQALAMVTSRPVVGVSALDALAAAAFASLGIGRARVCAWMDAARGEVFAAAYDATGSPGGVPALTALTDPEVDAPLRLVERWRAAGVLPAATADRIGQHPSAPDRTRPHQSAPAPCAFIGDGADRYAFLLDDGPRLAAPMLAPDVARLGRRLAGHGEHPPHALQPLYVRRPDAERTIRP